MLFFTLTYNYKCTICKGANPTHTLTLLLKCPPLPPHPTPEPNLPLMMVEFCLLDFEKPLNYAAIIFYFIGTLTFFNVFINRFIFLSCVKRLPVRYLREPAEGLLIDLQAAPRPCSPDFQCVFISGQVKMHVPHVISKQLCTLLIIRNKPITPLRTGSFFERWATPCTRFEQSTRQKSAGKYLLLIGSLGFSLLHIRLPLEADQSLQASLNNLKTKT